MAKRVRDGRVGNGQDGGAAPALCVGPMVLPLILWFVSHQGEMNEDEEKVKFWMASCLAMTRSGSEAWRTWNIDR